MPLTIVRNDITKMDVDAIINSTNTSLKKGGGVCGAIFEMAGTQKLQAECDAIGRCERGEAVITKGYNLPARHIIHTVGPVWNDGKSGESFLLRACYANSLALAVRHGCESIAFPLISSGIYGYPKDEALQIALDAIRDFLLEHELDVYLVVYDNASFSISKTLFSDIERYIDDNYVDEHKSHRMRFRNMRDLGEDRHSYESVDKELFVNKTYGFITVFKDEYASKKERRLESLQEELAESFSERLIRLIDEKSMKDPEVYNRANINRQLFSKIRCNHGYQPSKQTAIALAIALCLTLDETIDLLEKAGYTLSKSIKADVIIEYFIEHGMYDIFEINSALFNFTQTTLN